MKNLLQITALALTCSLFLFSSPELAAQGNGKGKNKEKQKDYKDYAKENEKEYKGYQKDKQKEDKENLKDRQKDYKEKYKGKNDKKFSHATPHKVNVPPGHYPPPGQCRLWYPGRPPGHQPPPVPCNQLVGVPLTDGAFILHGDRAYDTEYDWQKEEIKKPKTVPRQIIDILFPDNTVPAQ